MKQLLLDMQDHLRNYRGLQLLNMDQEGAWATSELLDRVEDQLALLEAEPADPYDEFTELVEAQKAGLQIQVLLHGKKGVWVDISDPSWDCAVENYRIKPEEQ